MERDSERSRADLKPRFPRLHLGRLKQRSAEALERRENSHPDWVAVPDSDGLLHIVRVR